MHSQILKTQDIAGLAGRFLFRRSEGPGLVISKGQMRGKPARDGMTDGWEATYGFDPLDDQHANEDADQDGFTNLEEYIKGTDPTDPNSHPSRAMPGIPLLLLDD